MINFLIDEFTPCLKDARTGELVHTSKHGSQLDMSEIEIGIMSLQSVFENCFLADVRHNLWEIKSNYALPNEGRIAGYVT